MFHTEDFKNCGQCNINGFEYWAVLCILNYTPTIFCSFFVCSVRFNVFLVQGMYERGGRVAYCVRTIVYAPTYLLVGHITSYIPVYHTCLNLSISIRVGYSI